jgi:putative endonuclease
MIPPPSKAGGQIARRGFVYLLRSLKDGEFYVGWTTDLKPRLEEHNAGLTTSTKHRRRFELMYYEIYPSPELAKNRERALKRNPNMLYHFKKRALRIAAVAEGGEKVMGDPTTCLSAEGG